jgi:hypothetical protein
MSANLNNNVGCKAEDKWTVKTVEAHFEEAIATLKKLPPVRQRGYFNSWPDVIYSPNELLFQEKKAKRILATPEAISRLEKTFEWMSWLEINERKLIWKRAAKLHWKRICWELGCDRTTAWRKWVLACTKISTTLNAKQIKRLRVATK